MNIQPYILIKIAAFIIYGSGAFYVFSKAVDELDPEEMEDEPVTFFIASFVTALSWPVLLVVAIYWHLRD